MERLWGLEQLVNSLKEVWSCMYKASAGDQRGDSSARFCH